MNLKSTGLFGWIQGRLGQNQAKANGFSRHVQKEDLMRKHKSNWRVLADELPNDKEGIYVAACGNGFITVCRWDSEALMFTSMGRDRNINFVVKWLLLPDTEHYLY